MNRIITIWVKELKDNLRDKRTILSMVVMPLVIMPLIFLGVTKLAQFQVNKAQETASKIALNNQDYAPSFIKLVKSTPKIEIVTPANNEQAVKDKAIDLAVNFPSDFEAKVQNEQPVSLEILQNSTNQNFSIAASRLNQAIATYNQQIYLTRFKEKNINPTILSPITPSPKDLATEKERGGLLLGFILPMLIVMWSIVGGQYIAIDVSAGEKERKTIEALLLTPAKRIEIVFGKLLAVMSAAFVSVILSLSSLYFTFKYFKLGGGGLNTMSDTSSLTGNLNLSLDIQTFAMMIGISILLIIMFSAILLSIGIFAKSYKEAQSYISPAYILVVLPVVFANSIPDFKPTLAFFAIPAVNAVLLFKEVLIGVFDPLHIALTVVSLLLFSLVAVIVASQIYSKETILFN
jgi:sodium transport system permease protein